MKTRLIIAWIGNLIDTVATLYLTIQFGGFELNPISAMLLQFPRLFIFVKLFSLTVAVIGIWIFRDRPFFKVASWILFIEYSAVALYYICIFLYLHLYTDYLCFY